MAEKKKRKRKPFPVPPPLDTLQEAKAWLREAAVGRGANCPCCNRFTKFYKRPISYGMAYVLIMMHRYDVKNTFFHVQEHIAKQPIDDDLKTKVRGDFAKLRYWGFIEEKPGAQEDGNPHNGYWRITDHGRAFVRGEFDVPAHAVTYKTKCLRMIDKKRVTIKDALRKKFHYDKLMRDEL